VSSYPDPNKPHRIEHDRWMTDPADIDYLPPAQRWCRVCAKLDVLHDVRDIEYAPGCHRIEGGLGYVLGRYITNSNGQIRWHVVYAIAGTDATLDTLLDAVARWQLERIEAVA
jgi:hypothetical protein